MEGEEADYNSLEEYDEEHADSIEENLEKKLQEGRYICNVAGCQKSYTRPAHLRRHILTHTGLKEWKCTEAGCALAFYTKQHLTRHMLLHQRDNPHKCTESGCDAAYSKRSKL